MAMLHGPLPVTVSVDTVDTVDKLKQVVSLYQSPKRAPGVG